VRADCGFSDENRGGKRYAASWDEISCPWYVPLALSHPSETANTGVITFRCRQRRCRDPSDDRTTNDVRQDYSYMVRLLSQPTHDQLIFSTVPIVRITTFFFFLTAWYHRQYDIHPDFPLGPPQLMMAYTADEHVDQELLGARDAYVLLALLSTPHFPTGTSSESPFFVSCFTVSQEQTPLRSGNTVNLTSRPKRSLKCHWKVQMDG